MVLLGGSGPLDRDENMGRNKPMKDLAGGLASRGVAVLCFDKVTFAHPAEIRRLEGITMVEEYQPATAAAVGLLKGHPAVDPGRIYLAGHSLGGTTPRCPPRHRPATCPSGSQRRTGSTYGATTRWR